MMRDGEECKRKEEEEEKVYWEGRPQRRVQTFTSFVFVLSWTVQSVVRARAKTDMTGRGWGEGGREREFYEPERRVGRNELKQKMEGEIGVVAARPLCYTLRAQACACSYRKILCDILCGH